MYLLRGMDTGNVMLCAEQFETLEEALKRACEIEKAGALVDLFLDDTTTPVMDFAQISAWCKSKSN
jgi:hypothetical protein